MYPVFRNLCLPVFKCILFSGICVYQYLNVSCFQGSVSTKAECTVRARRGKMGVTTSVNVSMPDQDTTSVILCEFSSFITVPTCSLSRPISRYHLVIVRMGLARLAMCNFSFGFLRLVTLFILQLIKNNSQEMYFFILHKLNTNMFAYLYVCLSVCVCMYLINNE